MRLAATLAAAVTAAALAAAPAQAQVPENPCVPDPSLPECVNYVFDALEGHPISGDQLYEDVNRAVCRVYDLVAACID
jgi:hypothetical protein